MANVIEITVKVKDQATAESAAIAEKIRHGMAAATQSGNSEGIQVPIEADASRLEQDVEQKVAHTKKPDPIKVPIETDAQRFERELSESFAEGEKHAEAASKAMQQSFSSMASGSRVLQSAMRELAKPVEDAGGAAEDFETQFRQAMEEGKRVSADADHALRQSFTSMESGSRTLRAAMVELQPAAQGAGNALQDVGNRAGRAGQDAQNAGNGFNMAAVRIGAMVVAAGAAAPALAAIPAVMGAVAVGAGTMALGFGGIIQALHAYGQQTASTGQSSAQMAQTEFSNAVAIRNAEQAIADAKKQAAQAAQSSADAIYSAQERVAQSAYNLQQSQQSLTDAEQSLTQAQQALTQAQKDAANQQIDLNNAAADSSIAVQQAELKLTEARENLQKVDSSTLSTTDQRTQAQIDLLSATQGLKDAQQKQVEAQQQADAANKSGVSGMQGVVSAQQAVQKATEGVNSAQHGVASAAQAQTDAQTALARAIQASSAQQANSAEAIQKAVQNLSDTYEQQKLAAAAAASAGSSGINAFQQAMDKLTPVGRAFVQQLIGMKGGLDQLKATAQNSMLPGFEPLLVGLQQSLPGINGAVGQLGTLIGNVATQFGKLLQSSAFRGEIGAIFKEGLGFATQFGDGFLKMFTGVTDAVSKAGPIVKGLGDGFQTLMSSGIPAFFQGLVSNAAGAGSTLNSILTIVSNLLGPIGTLAGSLSAALAPALQVLASPGVQQSLMSIATSIGQILLVLSPVITMIAQGLAGALRIVAPLLQSVAKFVQDNQSWFVPLAKAVTAATLAWIGLNAVMAASPLVLIASLIAGVVVGLIYAWEHFKGFRDFLKAMWHDIQVGFDAFLGFVKKWWPELLAPFTSGISLIIGHWNTIVDFVKKLPGRLADAAKGMWHWVTQTWDSDVAGPISKVWDGFINTVTGLPGRVAKAGSGLWHWIRSEFLDAVNGIAGLWNQLKFSTPSFHIPIPFTDGIDVSSITVGVPPIGPFKAAGGPISGGLSAIIGDRGWEPLRLPDGTTVIPHANAQAAAAAGALGGGQAAVTQLEWVGPVGDQFFEMFKKWIRVRGGTGPNSVQQALGQSW